MIPQITLFPLLLCLVKGSVTPTGYSLPNEDGGGSYPPQSSSTSQLYSSYSTTQVYSPPTSSSSCDCHHTTASTSTSSTSNGAPLIATCLTPSGSSSSSCTIQPTTTSSICTESSYPPQISFSTSTSTETDIVTPTSYVTVTSIITSTNAISTTSAESSGHGYAIDPTPWSTDSTTADTPTSNGISESSSTESSSTPTSTESSSTSSQADGGGEKPTSGISVMLENYLDITLYNDTECKTVQWSGSKAVWWMFGFYPGYFEKVFDVVRHEPGDGEQKEQWGEPTETIRCTASVTASPTEVYSMTVDRTSQPTSTDGPAFFSCTSLSAAQATQTGDTAEVSRCLKDGASSIRDAFSEFPEFIISKFEEFEDARGNLINNIQRSTSSIINRSTRLGEQEKRDLVNRATKALYADYESVFYQDGKLLYSLAYDSEQDAERRNGRLKERRKYNDSIKKANPSKSKSKVSKSTSQLDDKVKVLWGSYQSLPTNRSQWAQLVDKSKS
ncbi:hypothetical protein L486_08481 [Kwoniella mangroviensis CBS 10435]|uniref:Uncharacterized protein n=1 Tax=Kwoniella mangroviensis CBS 10435 TaxID=1331196 RepID=A0A1B9IF18_9TREE|nr:hypothetical protein L486_08481 [Kwoniella mangroviensis CBS 10435]